MRIGVQAKFAVGTFSRGENAVSGGLFGLPHGELRREVGHSEV